ncbi:ketodeoxygluconokinase [Vibrio galatheae]|uniref:2-dehydro-3-deoxygluconokinase n=1 Tax=Vibrio galatheae TaxID=579748 RepID=A0A0F4NIQ0_9VIBR|nr:sugar kinase [Vibrio galatheae]KJY81926.1 ketodeoxygluconokinase [Vibrio galatheae]
MTKIAIIGECMIEVSGELFGATQQSFGGDTLNTAVYLSRASSDIEVFYVTAMGKDALSLGIIARWQEEGINTEFVLLDEQRKPGLYLIQLDEDGERSFMYWRNQSAAKHMLSHPAFDSIVAELKNMEMVYISGISLAILTPEDRDKLLALLDKLHRQGVKIAFDSNYRPALWETRQQAEDCYQRIYAITDIALVTDEDESELWGNKCDEETIQRLSEFGVKQVVLKQGSKGAQYQNLELDDVSTTVPTIPVENVVDTTSAGDSFNAGFLSGHLTGKSIIDSITQGHLLAGCVIQHKGAIIPKQFTNPVVKTFDNLVGV